MAKLSGEKVAALILVMMVLVLGSTYQPKERKPPKMSCITITLVTQEGEEREMEVWVLEEVEPPEPWEWEWWQLWPQAPGKVAALAIASPP